MKDAFYSSSPWRKTRAAILERDGYRCQVQIAKGCTGVGECVDHIQPRSKGGSWLDPANLRASCTPCNSARANKGRATRKPKW